jgi:hypothetical protein
MSDVALICVSHGFHVRNLLYSRLYEHLVRQFRVLVILPSGVEVPQADRALLRGAETVTIPVTPHRWEKTFGFLRKNVFAGRERTLAFNLMSEIERRKHPVMYKIASYANAVLGRLPVFARTWRNIEGWFIRGTEFDALLQETQPKVAITANYGTEALEVRLLRAAHRHGVPTLAVIPSWDNLSSKGVIGENPQHLSVWNNIMRHEALTLYDFKHESVHVCGGLQFDVYATPRPREERDAILQRLGVDPQRPFVMIGTITPRYFAHNVEIVDILDEAVESGRLPKDLQIVVRLHPQVVNDVNFGDDLGPYRERAARSSRVKLSIPNVMRWGSITPPTPEDSVELMAILHGAAATVIPGSTLAIDACALGTPVIGIGFDGYQKKPYGESVRRMFDFTHYHRIVELGGLRIAESEEALIAEINAYLQNRSRDAEGRARIVLSHLGVLDGGTWQRILEVVQRISAPIG